MIPILAAAVLAFATEGAPPDRSALVQCLAYLAHGPEYAALNDRALMRSKAFLDDAKDHFCSDESGPFWPMAHERASTRLGISKEDDTSGTSLEQQEIAEDEMRAILREALSEAVKDRARPKPLPKERLEGFALSWLLSDRNQKAMHTLIEKPVACASKTLKSSRELQPEDIMAGLDSPAFRSATAPCGLETAQRALMQWLTMRFPELDKQGAEEVAKALLGQMTFYAVLGE
jgi:hypothetical protein